MKLKDESKASGFNNMLRDQAKVSQDLKGTAASVIRHREGMVLCSVTGECHRAMEESESILENGAMGSEK